MFLRSPVASLACVSLLGCANSASSPRGEYETLKVTATAYTLNESTSALGAWGDELEPGMKAIAVSRDLIPMGLDHMTEVEIEGLEGTYIVRDKMNARWTKKIDIFMGRDSAAAREWGKRSVVIRWQGD